MNFDIPPQQEQISESKKRLLDLEKAGNVVFHGSLNQIDELEPRQAYNNGKKDGKPAIFATPFADIAIFRALINGDNLNEESSNRFGMKDDDKIYFEATANLIKNAKKLNGKIYVFDKKSFGELEGTQCRSHQSMTPLEVIEVTADDLPNDIKLIKD